MARGEDQRGSTDAGAEHGGAGDTTLFLINPRNQKMLENTLQDNFPNILINNGYNVYRT